MVGIFRTLCFVAALMILPLSAAAQGKVGVVNLDEAFANSQAGKTALAQLKTKFEAREKTLAQQGEDLKKIQADLQKKSVALSQDAMKSQVADFEGKARKYTEDRNKLQQEAQEAQQQLLQPLLTRLQKVMSDFAKKGGYSVLMEARSVPYFDPALDVTDAIRQEFDKTK
ncbi:OmpH family outer membrane protein [Desulfolutivibrio sulfoxidireducens]|uniref:OmpH family outer membrane protein n=1 Tax=Desulfolutivibrio sulfoxidireducens TaxID=2773299 RepID=UPI00159D9685|nr:OmpH family outer membrane protein [Desulfolutivibrio sulfoxidireducens]QLA17353.1 OmpH family outer membrane protein [Desulfolutivibrio sulfoxidireducens]QLA20950.1 OmpH family outer membrane protein [Desulfolutivibrio sulfoxidireducens]